MNMEKLNYNDFYEMADMLRSTRCLLRSSAGIYLSSDSIDGINVPSVEDKKLFCERLDVLMSSIYHLESDIAQVARELYKNSQEKKS